jgi:hypothetical protein
MVSNLLRLLDYEHHFHGGHHHDLAGLGHVAQEVAQEVRPAPLPAAALEHALDRCRQAQVGIGDHQSGASEAALFERAQGLAQEAFGLPAAQGDPQYLAVAQSIDPDRHHHSPRHHLQVAAEAAVQVDGVEVGVWETGMVQRPAQKGFELLIEALAMRLTSDLEMPLLPPRASTRASTLRVEIPPPV